MFGRKVSDYVEPVNINWQDRWVFFVPLFRKKFGLFCENTRAGIGWMQTFITPFTYYFSTGVMNSQSIDYSTRLEKSEHISTVRASTPKCLCVYLFVCVWGCSVSGKRGLQGRAILRQLILIRQSEAPAHRFLQRALTHSIFFS